MLWIDAKKDNLLSTQRLGYLGNVELGKNRLTLRNFSSLTIWKWCNKYESIPETQGLYLSDRLFGRACGSF